MSDRILRLQHVQIRVPDLELCTAYYTEVLGLIETGHDEGRVFLKCWDEHEHHSVVLRLRCWPPQRAQRVPLAQVLQPRSPRSVPPRDEGRLLSLRPRFTPIGPVTSPDAATCRSFVCLRC